MLQIREPFRMSYGCFFKVGSPKIPLASIVSCHFRIETAIKRWHVPCHSQTTTPCLGSAMGSAMAKVSHRCSEFLCLSVCWKAQTYRFLIILIILLFDHVHVHHVKYFLKIHCKVWHCPDGQPWDIHPSSWLISIFNQPQRA